MCVSGCASARPGIASNAARVPELTSGPVGESGLHSSRSDETAGGQNELGAGLAVIFHIHLVQATDHLAFAFPDAGHVDREAVVRDAKFLASANVVHNFRAVDNVLAGKARNIGARAANILAIDDCDALAFAGKGPRGDGRTRAATENHEIKIFRLRVLAGLGGLGGFGAVHADFPFRATGSLLACIDFMSAADDAPSSDSP